eukprot:322968-Chlamydomonas_euryale.AAC.1
MTCAAPRCPPPDVCSVSGGAAGGLPAAASARAAPAPDGRHGVLLRRAARQRARQAAAAGR